MIFRRSTIKHQVSIAAPVECVYEAIATPDKIGRWWDKQTPVHTAEGLVLEHDPGPAHGVVRLLVVELIPDRRIEWACISTHPETSPASAWTGTRFIFDLAGASHGTSVAFRQLGYSRRSRYYDSNRAAWLDVLGSLKRTLEQERR